MVHKDALTASSVATSDGMRRITLAGELDLGSAPWLTDEWGRAAACPTRAVVLDLSELTFLLERFADGSISIDRDKVDNPDDYKCEPIAGGPTDPDAPS